MLRWKKKAMSDLSQAITSAIDVMFKMRVVIKEQRDRIETQDARIAELEAALKNIVAAYAYIGVLGKEMDAAHAALEGKGNE